MNDRENKNVSLKWTNKQYCDRNITIFKNKWDWHWWTDDHWGDGTNVNTGAQGVISLREKPLGRHLQWFVCLLHANELPIRHLVQKLDGGNPGPNAFSGKIWRALYTCEELPGRLEGFYPVVKNYLENWKGSIQLWRTTWKIGRVHPVVKNYLLHSLNSSSLVIVHLLIEFISAESRYLFNICEVISFGHCPDDLALEKPGPVIHSRWLTSANRPLRLYIATKNRNDDLITPATYVVQVYTPVWFNTKTNSACSKGARHVWKMIQLSKYLQAELRIVVDAVNQRNA